MYEKEICLHGNVHEVRIERRPSNESNLDTINKEGDRKTGGRERRAGGREKGGREGEREER